MGPTSTFPDLLEDEGCLPKKPLTAWKGEVDLFGVFEGECFSSLALRVSSPVVVVGAAVESPSTIAAG